jgi:hypothetical protein
MRILPKKDSDFENKQKIKDNCIFYSHLKIQSRAYSLSFFLSKNENKNMNKLEDNNNEEEEEEEDEDFGILCTRKDVNVHDVSMFFSGINISALMIFQFFILLDVQLLNFVRFDLFGPCLIAIGVGLWLSWAASHAYLYFSSRYKNEASIAYPSVSLLLPQVYVLVSVVYFGFVFTRWSHVYGARRMSIEEMGEQPEMTVDLVFSETTFASLMPISAFMLGYTFDFYCRLRNNAGRLALNDKTIRSK